MKMKAVLAVLLMAALTGAAHGQIRKKYIFVNSTLTWIEAQTFCRRNYVDLATIQTIHDYSRFIFDAGLNYISSGSSGSSEYWIGLSKNPNATNFTLWSDGSELSYRLWYYNIIGSKDCVYTNTLLYTKDCNTALKFVCYIWDSTPLVAVQEMKTWEEALNYCRMNYTDLVSLNTESDQTAIKNMSKKIQTPYFWTGLRFLDGSWFWVNQTSKLEESLLSDVSSMPSCPAPGFRCGAQSTTRYVLEVRDCEEKLNFICYNGTMN